MYHSSYIAVAEDDSALARANEWRALDMALTMLKAARAAGPTSREAAEALALVDRLWTFLIEDLANAENALPESLRAGLISIGLFVLKQGNALRRGETEDFEPVIEVITMIRDGLA